MTIDLRTARPGCEVTTHAGAKMTVAEKYDIPARNEQDAVRLSFEGYPVCEDYRPNGEVIGKGRPNPLDIVSITPPPLTDAEQVAEGARRFHEISKIARDMQGVRGLGYPYNEKLDEILALAEGLRKEVEG